MKPLMINATDRNTINTDNYQFYFNKLTSKGIKIQNDVKEKVKANGLSLVSSVCGIMGTCFMIYNYISSDTTAKTAALVAAGTSIIFSRTNTLFNYVCGDGTPSISETASQMLHHGDEDVESCLTGRETSYEVDQRSCFTDGTSSVFHHEYMNKKTGTLNKKGRDDLNNLYRNNQNFRDKVINFVGDKAVLSIDKIIDKRY